MKLKTSIYVIITTFALQGAACSSIKQADKLIDGHGVKEGQSNLLEAIILGDGCPSHTEVVCLLIEAGAYVNLADRNGGSRSSTLARGGNMRW